MFWEKNSTAAATRAEAPNPLPAMADIQIDETLLRGVVEDVLAKLGQAQPAAAAALPAVARSAAPWLLGQWLLGGTAAASAQCLFWR